ncbi:MAG: LLM class F420-dependent oxidoreductase [Actinomycetota bacterium]
MKVSIGYPLLRHPADPAFTAPEFLADFARVAEECGFDGVNLTEHPIPGDKWLAAGGHHALDPFVGLAVAATVTTRVRLMTNLTVLPYRNPFLLAKSVASLDRVSGGRVTLGVGTGYLKPEFFALGVDFEERNDLFDEAIAVCRQAWSGGSVTYEGRHFSARGNSVQPTPVQDPLPIWIGGNAALTRQRVATVAQGWMPMWNPREFAATRRSPVLETLEDFAAMLADVRARAEAAGRTEPLDVMFMPLDPALPGSPDWDADRHLTALRAQADLGVTWVQLTAQGDTPAAVLDQVRSYADTVVGALR